MKALLMDAQNRALKILKLKYQENKLKNPRWSLRAFANRCGMSSGAISEIMSGKRELTLKARQKIAQALQLSPKEQFEFFDEKLPDHLRKKRQAQASVLISEDQFCLISDWWHFAILNLLKTKNFRGSMNWISQRIGLPIRVVEQAWERLFRLGYIKKENQKIIRTYPHLNTTDGFFNLSIQKSHIEDLKLIENSIRNLPPEVRDFTSMTISLKRKDLKKAVEMIRLFQEEFEHEIESDEGDEVYRFVMSLFPLTVIELDAKK